MSEEIIIINDEPYYKIQNGTKYEYKPIAKEFKPYFERLQQENKLLKESLLAIKTFIEIPRLSFSFRDMRFILDKINKTLEDEENKYEK